MSLKIDISKKLIFSAPINSAAEKWGVYAIPRLWREPDGGLVVRFNGEQDTAFTEKINQAPNLYFLSRDNGNSWEMVADGESIYDIHILLGIGSPYLRLKSGEIIAFRGKSGLPPIKGISPRKRFCMPNGEAVVHTYKYGDIPADAKGLERIYYKSENSEPVINESIIDFNEREVFVNAEASYESEEYIPVPEYIQPFIFKNPYIAGLTELNDGTIVALTFGQNPSVCDRYCPVVYILQSADKGLSWQLRGTVASSADEVPYGYSGDGNEASLAVAENGDLLCAMRMLAVSHDGGFTWEKPFSVADSSVTPHIVALDNGILILIYGRPGVHFKISEDNGKSWSEPHSIIGLTLEEERQNGKSDAQSKYFDTSSYSNTFVEKISGDTVAVVYNDMKYVDTDGKNHKTGFVGLITVKRV